jgi:hypothetical protein
MVSIGKFRVLSWKVISRIVLCAVFVCSHLGAENESATKTSVEASAAKPAATAAEAKIEKDKKRPAKHVIKMADDVEDDSALPAKDPATYELSNKKLLAEYGVRDAQPFDRGEHMLISGLMGGIGGAFVGGLIGFVGFDKNDETASKNNLYLYGGIGAGVGAVSGIFVTFFERGKIEQFSIGRFLLKYSWYGAIGGGLLGAGVGFIPYASSNDYGDILRYGGYGAAIGLAAGLTLFAFDLPDHLKLYTYRREDQNVLMVSLRF